MYRESRLRLTTLMGELPHPESVHVPSCPEWSARDVVSHLLGGAEDVLAGTLSGPPTPEHTATQVARCEGKSMAEILEAWDSVGPGIEELLRSTPSWPVAMDALTHEWDVRGAAGVPGERDMPEIALAAHRLLDLLRVPADLTIDLDGELISFRPEGDQPLPHVGLTTTAWEAFRFRLGRRSRRQLEAMAWTGDPTPILDSLFIFGPSEMDIVEQF
jgi:uncharacterized protein (TIGR03083 family)